MKTFKINSKLILLLIVFFSLGRIVKAQDDQEISVPPHYVFAQFTKGTVKLKDGRTETPLLNYNKLTEEIIFINNGQNLSLTRLETIDTVTIQNRKFVPQGKGFYELVIKAPISLFMQYKARLQMVGNEVGYGGTSLVSATTNISSLTSSGMLYSLKLPPQYNVEDDSHNWIRKDAILYLADNERDIKKIFPEKETEIKVFFKTNKLKLKNLNDAKKLVEFLNTWK